MVLGCYYLTANNPTEQTIEDQYFFNFADVIRAYRQSAISLHTFVWVRVFDEQNSFNLSDDYNFVEKKFTDRVLYLSPEMQIKKTGNGDLLQSYIKTTPGRIILNNFFRSK
jgi:DNA-directed RNA polymerase subunit beta'